MKLIILLMTLCVSNIIHASEIIEHRPDGSKTIWHDDGRRVDYDAKGKVV